MKHATLTALATLAIGVSAAGSALAGEGSFGKDGQFIISGERLFGLAFTTYSSEDGTTHDKQSDSRTNFSLLWPGLNALSFSPYVMPHAALDFVVASGVTLGGSIGFASSTGTTTSEPQNGPKVERDSPSITELTFQPRVGYALSLSDNFAFWPRIGITYYSIKIEQTSTNMGVSSKTTNTLSGLGLDLEAMFVFTPIEHFGITLTPLADIPLSGSSSTERSPNPGGNPPDDKEKFMAIGGMFGLLGYI